MSETTKNDLKAIALNVLPIILFLFLFLVGVKSMEGGIKLMGGGFAKTLFTATSNPIVALFAGMLATVLVQSSSATTSIIVGLVSAGSLPVEGAVPMVMGANLGTSVTNTLVSLGHFKNDEEFKHAFAAATIHDFFNIFTVLALLPIELSTGILSKTAKALSSFFYGSAASFKFHSPLKAALKPVAGAIKGLYLNVMGLEAKTAGLLLLITSGVIVIGALTLIVRKTKKMVDKNEDQIIERLLSKNAYASVGIGALFTFFVQSSSITTSLLVPLAGTGVLSLRSIFPVTVGANIGTTTTALLAALAGNVHGLTIAIVHLLFNIAGTLLFFVPAQTRALCMGAATMLAEQSGRRKGFGLAYIAAFFFVLPLSVTYLLG